MNNNNKNIFNNNNKINYSNSNYNSNNKNIFRFNIIKLTYFNFIINRINK